MRLTSNCCPKVLGLVSLGTVGSSLKWRLVQGDGAKPPDLVHVGYKKAVKVKVFVNEGIGGRAAFIRDEWYPNDKVHVLNAIRTMGNPAPRVEVTWKVFGLITRRVVLTG